MSFVIQFEKVIATLGDDPSTAQPDEVFGVFEAFLTSIAEARQENMAAKKRKEEEEKRSIQEAEVKFRTPESYRVISLLDVFDPITKNRLVILSDS